MRFSKAFSRSKGGGAFPVLGSDGALDVAPTGVPDGRDNHVAMRSSSSSGYPLQRIAVSYKGPALAVALTAQLWVYERLTETWYRTTASFTLTPGLITAIGALGIADTVPRGVESLGEPTGGAVDAVLVVQDTGAAPVGTHTFAIVGDLSAVAL